MEILKDKYSITELSENLKLTDHTLRFYEKEFGLAVPKDERGRRYYTTELANLMYKIKVMRNEGLEIKAIKKIMQEDVSDETVQLVKNENNLPVATNPLSKDTEVLQLFFKEFGKQLTQELILEISAAKDHISKEIYKTKQELGACVENSSRKLENKMDKHYQDVDRAIGLWREKSKKNPFKRLFLGHKILSKW